MLLVTLLVVTLVLGVHRLGWGQMWPLVLVSVASVAVKAVMVRRVPKGGGLDGR